MWLNFSLTHGEVLLISHVQSFSSKDAHIISDAGNVVSVRMSSPMIRNQTGAHARILRAEPFQALGSWL